MKKLFLLVVLSCTPALAEGLIHFHDTTSGTWSDMKTLAAQQQKLIFIDAYTDWCSWCKVMDKETFSDPGVADVMNKKFINVRYEMETGFGMQMAAKYRVSGFPTFLVFSPDGKLVYRILGYLKSKEFLEQIEKALDPSRQEHLAGITPEMDPGFPEFYMASFGKKQTRLRPDSATVNTYLASQKNLAVEVPFSVASRFYPLLEPRYKQYLIDHYDTLSALYGRSDLESVASQHVRGKLSQAIAQKSEPMLDEVLALSSKYFPESSKEAALAYRTQFYAGTKQWGKFADEVDRGIASKLLDENGLNNVSWTVYERCDEKPVIERAASWMKVAVAKAPRYMFLDTYAAVLFKKGDLNAARDYAQKAIAAGKEEKTDYKETEALLEKITSRLAAGKKK